MKVAGIDIGSLTAKCVIMENGKVLGYDVVKVQPDLEKTAEFIFKKTLEKLGVKEDEIEKIVATGYGRNKVSFADKKVTEISCHAKGAVYLIPTVRTVIDIGGQDSKVISVGKDGRVLNFVMNDKCAAGTGRFLEVLANALGVKVEELSSLSKKANRVAKISSVCTVFAESEVISYISRGEKVENIVAGIHESIASRIAGMVKRIGVKKDVVLTGGVAKNDGVRLALERKLDVSIKVPKEPQIVGALGAAIFAGV